MLGLVMIAQLLGLLSRYGRVLLPAGVFLGILLPDLATVLRPWVTPAVIGTLTGALLQLDWERLRAQIRRPLLPLDLLVWQLIVSPLMVWAGVTLLGLSPSLSLALVLQTAAPPIGSAAVFVLLLGLDAALAMVVTVITILLLPLTLTPLVAALPDSSIEIDLLAFFFRVTLLVLLPFVIAGLVRRGFGVALLARNASVIGGINVLLLVIFAIGVMDGVTVLLFSDPAMIGRLLGAACVMAVLLHVSAYVLFARAGRSNAISAAICSGNRNMGLMLAITAGTAGAEFSIYVGLAQIPMYFAPLVIAALLRR